MVGVGFLVGTSPEKFDDSIRTFHQGSLDSIFGDDANYDRAPKGEQNIGHRIGYSE